MNKTRRTLVKGGRLIRRAMSEVCESLQFQPYRSRTSGGIGLRLFMLRIKHLIRGN